MRAICLFLLFYLTSSDAVKYIGCYKEISVSARLMTGDFTTFPNELTPELCIRHCMNKNMDFAGLQYRKECFCDTEKPSFIHLAENNDCNMTCEGDESLICGGGLRISVYDITEKADSSHSEYYLGCFTPSIHESPSRTMHFPRLLRPDFCIGQCWREGYRFAGLMSGTECRCSDSVSLEHKTNTRECSVRCPGDRNFHCGGDNQIDLYKTGISDVTSSGKLLGCYDDQGSRILSGTELWLQSTNSPKKCINICLSLGYQYSGVEYKFQCFCGNVKPAESRKAMENECHSECPEKTGLHCGGNWRIMIYKTGLNEVELNTIEETTTMTLPDPILSVSTNELAPNNNKPVEESQTCVLSLTTVKGDVVCSGAVIFSEEFEGPLNRRLWQHVVMMPGPPDYEFVSFTNNKNISYIENGKLIIKPKLYDEEFIREGYLNLQGCTGELFSTECERQAVGFAILPPIESARYITKESFSFRYGRVDIRARLPKGDWVYPELWLEPRRLLYGPNYSSGRLRIATARGNPILLDGRKDLGNRMLESGIVVGLGETVKDITVRRISNTPWSSDFHNYSVVWTPDNIEFYIDGKMSEKILPNGGKAGLINLLNFNTTSPWTSSSQVRTTPFDHEFYLSVGLSSGGIRNFPDGTYSSGKLKPWKNIGTKAMANFYRARNDWITSWSEKTTLEIESIRVVAL